MALMQDRVHEKAVAAFGPESQWTAEQRAAYRAAVTENQIQTMRELEQERTFQRQQNAAIIAAGVADGLKSAGDSIASSQTDPLILYKMNASRQGYSGTPAAPIGTLGVNRYDPNSLANPYGAGSPYKADGLMNPYSQYGSRYSNKSWRNPYATDAPKLYDQQGNYRGKLSKNQYDADSTSNPYGRYGSKYSPDSINNPYGAGNPYSKQPINVVPSP